MAGDEGAVITGKEAVGMQEHVECREVWWCSRALWVQCAVRGALEVAEIQRRLVVVVWGAVRVCWGADWCRECKYGAYGAQRGAGELGSMGSAGGAVSSM